MKPSTPKSWGRLFAVLGCLAFTSSCGGKSTPTGPTPTQETTSTGTVAVFGTNRHPLSIFRSGTMRLTLNWSGPADLDLYLTSSSCTDLYADGCQRFDAANGTVNPEVISRSVVSGETYNVFVDNLSETLSVSYTLSVLIP